MLFPLAENLFDCVICPPVSMAIEARNVRYLLKLLSRAFRWTTADHTEMLRGDGRG